VSSEAEWPKVADAVIEADQLAEEEPASGDQQLHPEGHCSAHEGLLQKRGGDGHLCRIGEQLGGRGVYKLLVALLRTADAV